MSSAQINLDATRDPWDRQPGETPKQHSRFLIFRGLGRVRSVKRCVQALNTAGDPIAHRTLQQVAWIGRWTERAEAWDVEQERDYRELLVADRKAMVARHRQVATSILGAALTALKDMAPGELDAADIVRMVKLATDLERAALELPTATVAVTGPAGGPVMTEDLTGLDPQARRARLRELAAELALRSGAPIGDDDDD